MLVQNASNSATSRVVAGGRYRRPSCADASVVRRELVLGASEEEVVHRRQDHVDGELRRRDEVGELEQDVALDAMPRQIAQ